MHGTAISFNRFSVPQQSTLIKNKVFLLKYVNFIIDVETNDSLKEFFFQFPESVFAGTKTIKSRGE